MNRHAVSSRAHERGAILIGVLFAIVVVTVMVMGMGQLAWSHRARADTDARFAVALDLAEAGVNYEVQRINGSAGNADVTASTITPINWPGSFTVKCTMQNGAAWDKTTVPFLIVSTGTIGPISRTVRIQATQSGNSPNYALFGVRTSILNGGVFVAGDVGTNQQFTFNGTNTIGGTVYFNGAGSGWQSPPSASYTVKTNAAAVNWPTVESLATAQFPSGGLPWLATHNDNALATPAIAGNMILLNSGTMTLKGKAGGANYYLTSLTCNGSSIIAFDNTAGPINICLGPSGRSGTFVFNGGTAAVNASSDTSKPVRILSAANNDMIINGSNRLDAGLYNVNSSGQGRVIFNGSPSTYGPVITNYFIMNGGPHLNWEPNMFQAGGGSGFAFSGSWSEVGGR